MVPHKFVDLEIGQSTNLNGSNVKGTNSSLKKWNTFFTYMLVVLGILLVFACFTFIVNKSNPKIKIPLNDTRPPTKSLYDLSSQGTTSIQDVCNITTYPNVCSSTLKGLKDLSWSSCMQVTLQASLSDIKDAYTKWKATLDASLTKNGIQYSTIQQCVEDYDSAQSAIKDSLALVKDSNIKPPPPSLDDLNQYISAAATFHDDCLDALQDYGSVGTGDIPFATSFNGEHLTEVLSNALALLGA